LLAKIRKYLKVIFPMLLVLLLVGLVLSRIYQPEPSVPEPEIEIKASEADHNIGRPATVCGRVASAKYVRNIKGSPTFLNLGRAHPNAYFTAVIWGNNRSKWESPPEEKYLHQRICVTGRIRSHEGTPQIEVQFPSQIQVK
jgi:DNA/RNA endonuclease YhcR with UshA esterase domain